MIIKPTYDLASAIVVLGGGESGVGAAILASKHGYDVFVSDAGPIKEHFKRDLEHHEIAYEEGGHDTTRIEKADVIIKSPGIPSNIPLLLEAKTRGQKVISELEWAWLFHQGKVIAVTGSNGKTTTVNWIFDMLQRAKISSALVGNVGTSYARYVAEQDVDVFVVEVSSFQLDDIDAFRPDVALILNITPDHLDRYEYSMDLYAQSKWRITKNQTAEDLLILSADDPSITKLLSDHGSKAKTQQFSIKTHQCLAHVNEDKLKFQFTTNPITIAMNDLILKGNHNVYNSLAAGMAARAVEVQNPSIRESLERFDGLPHRMERVLRIGGRSFINDSKATNVNSTWYALEAMNTDVVWIAGGVDKGNDYSILEALVHQKVKSLVCIGADNRKLHEAFAKHVGICINVSSMTEAVQVSYQFSDPGDSVILSPACASFDRFASYEDRGDQFKQAVREL